MCVCVCVFLHLKGHHIHLTVFECVVVRINLLLSLCRDSQGETPALTALSTITCFYSHTQELNPLIYTDTHTHAHRHTRTHTSQLLSFENKTLLSTLGTVPIYSSFSICLERVSSLSTDSSSLPSPRPLLLNQPSHSHLLNTDAACACLCAHVGVQETKEQRSCWFRCV